VLGRDGIAGLICLGGSLWLLSLTRGLPQPALVPIGPGFYPRIVLGLTAVLAAILVAADVLAGLRAARRRRGDTPSPLPFVRNPRLVAITFGVFGAYVFLLPVLGYRIATVLFVMGLQVVLDPPRGRRWIRVLIVALLTAWLTHLVFEAYLSVLMPRGRLTGM
jgi:hypothetical protein